MSPLVPSLRRRLTLVALTILGTVGALGSPLFVASGGAQTDIMVTTGADPALADTDCTAPTLTDPCSLRAAVQVADTEGGQVTIDFPASTGTTYDLTLGELDITADVTFYDPGDADDVTINGQQLDRDIDVEPGGSLTLVSITVIGGQTTGPGGGIEDQGTLTMTGSVLGGNKAASGGGLAVMNGAAATLNSDQVADNTATSGDGGGIDIVGSSTAPTTSLTSDTISGNTASGAGGGVAQEGGGAFSAVQTGFLQNGATTGGGLFLSNPAATDTVSGGTFYQNTATDGAGLALSGGAATLSTSSIYQNTATDSGGAVFDDETMPSDGSLSLTTSSLTNDGASGTAGATPTQGLGGGVALVGCQQVTLVNDTLADDSAEAAGGGLGATGCNAPPPSAFGEQLSFDTLTGNRAPSGSDLSVSNAGEVTTVGQSILADGAGTTSGCAESPLSGLASDGHNLNTGPSCGQEVAGDLVGTSPDLGGLGHNGSTTDSAVPAAGSPAIAAVPAAACAGVTADQNNTPRPLGIGGSCTIGSVEVASPRPTPPLPVTTPAPVSVTGYRFVATDGGIFDFGQAGFEGSAGATALRTPIVGMATTPDGAGYWLVSAGGDIFAFGDAGFFGSLGTSHLNQPIVAMTATPDGRGYWLVASDGGIFAFGDAAFFGSTGALHLNKPIVGLAATADGQGYWLVASDGGIFAFGDADFFGSTGALHLNKPIVGMAATAYGRGYWLVASDGGIFAFGDAPFAGSTGALHLNQPIVGMASTADGEGYWLVAADGGIFAFGDAPFLGSTGALHLNKPIVGMSRA
jgi:hypothetical protein